MQAVPCALFVALAEEGWTAGAIAEAVAHRYLDPLFDAGAAAEASVADVLVLGCTHFPLLAAPIRAAIGPAVRFLATDSVARFAGVGAAFLGMSIAPHQVELIDL